MSIFYNKVQRGNPSNPAASKFWYRWSEPRFSQDLKDSQEDVANDEIKVMKVHDL
jgi:hypothetical protein